MFGEDWLAKINDSKQEMLKINYLNGYPKSFEEFYKNRLKNWRVVEADKNQMIIQLDFKSPLYVNEGPSNCRIKLNFGDGKAFKNAGFGNSLKNDTVRTVELSA